MTVGFDPGLLSDIDLGSRVVQEVSGEDGQAQVCERLGQLLIGPARGLRGLQVVSSTVPALAAASWMRSVKTSIV